MHIPTSGAAAERAAQIRAAYLSACRERRAAPARGRLGLLESGVGPVTADWFGRTVTLALAGVPVAEPARHP